MKKEEKNIVEQVVEPTVDDNVTPVVEAKEDENQDENVTVDNNTEIDPEPTEGNDSEVTPDVTDPVVTDPVVTDTPVGTEPIISEPVVTPEPAVDTDVPLTNDPVVDTPVEDPTLATTDEVIPAPVDVPAEDVPVPDDPATIIPLEPVVPEGPGPETICACGDPNCDGSCGTECSPEPCSNPSVTVANFFGTLQECVTIIWRFHLKTRKHHVHVDLNDFYEGALNKVDNIIEQYQGICGIIEDPFTNCIVGEGKDEISYLQELKSFIENNKCVLGDHSEINSSIDDFLGLIDSTLYKLTSFTESAVKSFEEFVYEDYEPEV